MSDPGGGEVLSCIYVCVARKGLVLSRSGLKCGLIDFDHSGLKSVWVWILRPKNGYESLKKGTGKITFFGLKWGSPKIPRRRGLSGRAYAVSCTYKSVLMWLICYVIVSCHLLFIFACYDILTIFVNYLIQLNLLNAICLSFLQSSHSKLSDRTLKIYFS